MEKKRDMYSNEEICVPPRTTSDLDPEDPNYFRRKNANYSLLDDNGVIRPRQRTPSNRDDGLFYNPATVVKKNDVLVGKVIVKSNKTGEETKIDVSVVVQQGEEGTIDRVETLITPDGYRLVKIVIRQNRVPSIGDKLASCMAQKGTIGMLYRQEDMPFSAQGICPDLIISPNCIPSRMTINQLIATALGKCVLMTGVDIDATPFTEESVDIGDRIQRVGKEILGDDPEFTVDLGGEDDEETEIPQEKAKKLSKAGAKIEKACKRLEELGFRSDGWEMLHNGMTGEVMNARIFMGPTYYQRLKHMVGDKMHARAKGAVTTLTKQPSEGKESYCIYGSNLKMFFQAMEQVISTWTKFLLHFLLRNTKIDISCQAKATFSVEEPRVTSRLTYQMGA